MLIEPRDPLIVRDGRPFDNTPGARARSLPFPLPQTLAGAYRARRGMLEGLSFPEDSDRVRAWGVRGPLLVEERGGTWRLLVPRPLDALRIGHTVYPLRPLKTPEGAGTNLPAGLELVGLKDPFLRDKPTPLKPFWSWDSFERWLLGASPSELEGFSPEEHPGPVPEVRTHVSLDPAKGSAREGFLFQTSGLEFVGRPSPQEGPRQGLRGTTRLALVLWPEDEKELEGMFPLGGERRLAFWHKGGPKPPRPPEGLLEGLVRYRAARLFLLTPGFFQQGFLPRAFSQGSSGPKVVAVALERPLAVSGWDLKENRPKPSRRAVPMGSVYFLRFPEGWDEGRIARWLEAVWFQNVSDEEQDQKDGFGLAAVGLWDGALLEWEGR
ncbi:MAG: CRISPR-associated protein Cmr3 [Thermus sp.]